jgi:hypothetical protein
MTNVFATEGSWLEREGGDVGSIRPRYVSPNIQTTRPSGSATLFAPSPPVQSVSKVLSLP